MKVTTKQTKTDNLSLSFSPFGRVRLTFSRVMRAQMTLLYERFRHYSTVPLADVPGESLRITHLYKKAFADFLFINKIPKVIPKVERAKHELTLDDETISMLNDMRKVAMKRNQPMSVIVEEALQAYLDKPENYLGATLQKPGKTERVS